jgi:dihydroorotase
VELLTSGPARTFGVPGGSLTRGTAADITVVDPEVDWVVDASKLHSKSRNTPFEGWNLKGRAVRTFVGGRQVHEHQGERCSCPA